MMVRMFNWNEYDVYRFYNVDSDEYPNLPPPPNPTGLQVFFMACLEVTIDQMNDENDPDGARKRKRAEERREEQAIWGQVRNR